MSAYSEHAETAIDQIKLADDYGTWLSSRYPANDAGELGNLQVFTTGAVVHALLAVAEAIRETGAGVSGWSELDAPEGLED